MGRLFPLDDEFWTLSAVIVSLNDARAADHLKRDLARLPGAEAAVRSQRDYEAAMMGESQRPVSSTEKEELPADQLEARVQALLGKAGIRMDIASLRGRMSGAEYPLDVVDGLLKKGRFVNEEHMEETFAGLVQLWNTTARPEQTVQELLPAATALRAPSKLSAHFSQHQQLGPCGGNRIPSRSPERGVGPAAGSLGLISASQRAPPRKFIRLTFYRYRFTDWGVRRAGGAWWQRDLLRYSTPTAAASFGSLKPATQLARGREEMSGVVARLRSVRTPAQP